MAAIETNRLTRKFGELTAVNRINLQVQEGELFGFLGPNGAGKTTTLNMLCTLLAPTSGSARVNGFDVQSQPDEVRRSIGMVFQDPSLDEELTGWENLELHAEMYGMRNAAPRIHEMLQLVDLEEKRNNQVKEYSGGMKRRLEIARGLIHHPRVLFLDEPTLGLDPQTRRHIGEYVKKMNRKEKVTVILTTHYLEEADNLCDRIAIVDYGKVVALDTPKKLKKKHGGGTLEDVFIKLTGREIREEKGNAMEGFRARVRAMRR